MAMPQAPGMDPWAIQPPEKAMYKQQFDALKPINGHVTGDQAKGFLLQSGLPPAILGKIWSLSDTDADGKLDVNEFSIAYKLITLKLRGLEIPPALPPSLLMSLKSPIPASPSVSNGGFPVQQQNVGSLVNLGGAVPPQPVPLAQPGRPAPPMQMPLGAGFNATTGILPPPKPAPPSFPNSPVGAAMVSQPLVQPTQMLPGMQAIPPMGVPGVGVVPMAGGAPIAPLNTTPAPIQAFGMGPAIPPLIQPIPGVQSIPGVQPIPGILPTGPSNGVAALHQPPVAIAAVMSTPVSTNTPLSTTARPPSIDRVGSMDSQHSQHSQQSQQSLTSPPTVDWAVPHQTKLKYTQLFNTWDRTRTGFLSGPQARNIMVQTQLPQPILAQIWGLSDMDSDGRLGCEEFVLAMHLCDLAKAGETIPASLTPDLVPPTFRRQRQSSISSGGLPETIDPSAGMPQSSFEDKRKENYEKGQAELDRRRKTLLDQQRKEQEERERKEREEADKLEKIRLEQERRRQAEIEKQLLRQRELEQEKEEQRRRAQDQREAARKEMERQRQLEWETQKSQELQAQRQKEQDILLKLKAKNQTLTIELSTLNDKVKELSQKICDTRVGVSGVKTTIDGMRATRDSQQQEMTALKTKLREQNQRLLSLSQEKARIEAKNKMNSAQDVAGQEAMRMAFANKQITLKQMKDKIEDLEKQISEKMQDVENNNGQLEEMQGKMKELAADCKGLFKSFDVKRSQILELRGAVTSGGVDYTNSAWAESAWGPTEPDPAATDAWPVDSNEPEVTEPGIVKYRALYEFVARNDEEISFQPGDIILVPPVQNKEPGWMAGEIRGHTGWFPESYVEPVDPVDAGVEDSANKFVQQDSVERKPLEEIVEVPENVSDAGSLGGEGAAVPESAGGTLGAVQEGPDYYVALYQYSSAEPDDLSFNEGEIIEVVKKEGEWWSGTIGGRTGYFPSNYVEKCEPNINQIAAAPVQATPAAATVQASPTTVKTAEQLEDERQAAEDRAELPDFTAMASQQGRGRKPEIVQVLAPYQATSAEQLDLQRGQLIMIRKKTDSGWWEGELQARGKKRQIGWFPASYVKPLTSSSNRSTPVSHGYQDSPTDPNAERVMALYPHQPQNDDELSFEKGDVITVLAKQEEAWWKGELNGVIGIFPSNYVTPMS